MTDPNRIIYVVRHAKAGERRLWKGKDIQRPLSKEGQRQSKKVAERLGKRKITHLFSSEYTRCTQTLKPLGKILSIPVEVEDRLTEGEPLQGMLDLIHEAPGGSVLCSHGDLIPPSIDELVHHGTKVTSEFDWRKATVWTIVRNKHQVPVQASVWPPPGKTRKAKKARKVTRTALELLAL